MLKPGTWKFIDRAVPQASYTQVLPNTNISTIRAAFASAVTALAPANNDNLHGYDPAGHRVKYNSTTYVAG